MKRSFFYFAWKELVRSSYLGKSMATKGVLIFLAVYFSLVALVMGFYLSDFLNETFPGQSPINAFNSIVFIYAGIDLVIRIMVQNLPTFGFQPFLIIPVKRKRIAYYMLNKSVLHFFNILPLFLLLPFTFRTVVYELSGLALAAWLVSLFLLIFVNHFLAIYIKWRTNESTKLFYGFLILSVAVFAVNHFGIFDIAGTLGQILNQVIKYSLLVLAFPVLIFALYILNRNYLWNRFYLDELSQRKKKGIKHDFSWLNQVGEYGKMLSLEVKMIARNKRPRTSAVMSVVFIFYGLIIYKGSDTREIPEAMMVFGGMFMTGIFSMTYGQFFPAWHSRYYPFLMAQNVKMKQVLQSAFFLMAATNIIFYLLSLGYMYINPKVLYIHLVVMLYNIGVNSFVIFALGLNSRKTINLDERGMFNYQGMGATQWLMAFPIIFGPMAVYGILSWVIGNIGAYIVLGSLGVIGIVLHPRFLDYFTKEYLKRKHRMLAAYKKS